MSLLRFVFVGGLILLPSFATADTLNDFSREKPFQFTRELLIHLNKSGYFEQTFDLTTADGGNLTCTIVALPPKGERVEAVRFEPGRQVFLSRDNEGYNSLYIRDGVATKSSFLSRASHHELADVECKFVNMVSNPVQVRFMNNLDLSDALKQTIGLVPSTVSSDL